MKKVVYIFLTAVAALLISCGGKQDYNQALIADKAHRTEQALGLYEKVIQEHPTSGYADKARKKTSGIYLQMARKDMIDGKIKLAEKHYKRAAEILPDDEAEGKKKILHEHREKLATRLENKFITQLRANSGIPEVEMTPDGTVLTLFYKNKKQPEELARFYALTQFFGRRNIKSSLFDRYPKLDKILLHSYRPKREGRDIKFTYSVTRDAVKDITAAHWDDMFYMFRDSKYYAKPGRLYGTGEVDIETNFFAVKFFNWAEAYVQYSGPGAEKLSLTLPEDPGKDDEPEKWRKVRSIDF